MGTKLIAAMATVLAVPGLAWPAYAGASHEVNSAVVTDTWFDCLPIVYESTTTMVFKDRAQWAGEGPYRYSTVTDVSQVNTNLATGKTLRFEIHQSAGDVKVTQNADGTTTIIGKASGVSNIYAGRQHIFVDFAGTWLWRLVMDFGDPETESDDVELSFEFLKEAINSQTDDVTFCDVLATYTS